jgi:hypothetical protein
MILDQQIREKQDNIAKLMTARDKAVGAIQNDIHINWNGYQSRIDALGRTGSMNAHDQATGLKAEQREAFNQLGAKKMQIEADYESQLNKEYQSIKSLQDERKLIEKTEDQARFDAKIKAIQEQKEADRQERERQSQLTPEQRKAEDQARFAAKLKEMQERSPERER